MQPYVMGVVKQWQQLPITYWIKILPNTTSEYTVSLLMSWGEITLPPALVWNMHLFDVSLQATIKPNILELEKYAKFSSSAVD